tara:strand:- start:113 stop:499 length:387 start_codon:yes stop_codon:yes gene_type:complete
MPDFSLGIGNLFGRFAKDEKQPERRSSGGGQSSFSDRSPTPKPIGGPLTGLGKATITGLGNIFGGLKQGSQDLQDISGKTQESAGKFFGAITGAPGAVIEGAAAPVGQLTKDVLPLAAIAAAVLLLRK